jgi:hypothetical protein
MKLTPWPEYASGLYWPSNCRLSAKLVSTFANRRCHVVSVTDPNGSILGLDRSSSYFLFQVIPIYIAILVTGLWDVKDPTLSGQSDQMAIWRSALRTGGDLLPRNVNFLLLELSSVTGWVHPRALYGMMDYVNLNISSLQRVSNPRPSGWYNRALFSKLQRASTCVC